jgi:hypothetical protein
MNGENYYGSPTISGQSPDAFPALKMDWGIPPNMRQMSIFM